MPADPRFVPVSSASVSFPRQGGAPSTLRLPDGGLHGSDPCPLLVFCGGDSPDPEAEAGAAAGEDLRSAPGRDDRTKQDAAR